MPSVLFVCYGNTCRSPIAEACFKSVVEKEGISHQWKVDSAGTNIARLNQPPDPRGKKVMEEAGLYQHVEGRFARTVTKEDFTEFDLILAMDDNNYKCLMEKVDLSLKSKVKMFGDFDNKPDAPRAMADPYHSTDPMAYKEVLDRCIRLSSNLYHQWKTST